VNAATPPGRYSRDGWAVIDCDTCGFVHLRDVPETVELEETLAWEKTYAAEAVRRKRTQPVLQWLDAKTRWRLHILPRVEGVDILNRRAASGPALDLGCGGGGNLMKFADRFIPYGVEVSKHLAAEADGKARARGGHVVQASSAEGLTRFPERFFTAALLRSYLEHDWQAREVLHALAGRMAPGGLVAVKVPNYGCLNRKVMGANWCGFRLPDHVNYFDPPSLTRLAEEAGFTVSLPLMRRLPTDDNMLTILTRPG
jgi:SAM-dependent methyltransferase